MADVPVPSDAFPAIHPQTGELVEIPASAVQQAIKDGFIAPTPEQSLHWAQQKHYGGGWEAAKAFAEGVGEGVLGPVIPGMEVASGVPAEEIRARKEANPGINAVGQGVGFVAPLVATLGMSAPAQATGVAGRVAAKTLPGLMTAAGETVAKGVARVAGEGALGRIATTGAKFATEGALLGASSAATQAVVPDPDAPLTMEKVAAEIGFSALAGGVLGAGGKTLAEAVPTGLGTSIGEWITHQKGTLGGKAAGAIQSDVAKVAGRLGGGKSGQEAANQIGQEIVDHGLVGPTSTPASVWEAADTLRKQAFGKMDEAIKTIDALPDAPRWDIKGILQKVLDDVATPLAENPHEAATASRLASLLEGYASKYEGVELTTEALHGIRKQISADASLYGGKLVSPLDKSYGSALKGFRNVVDDALDEGMALSPAAADLWRVGNREYQVAKVAQGYAEAGAKRLAGNNTFGLSSTLGAVAGVVGGGPVGGVLGGVGTELFKRHGSGVGAWMLSGVERSLTRMVEGGESKLAAGMGRVFEAGGAKAGAEVAERVLTPSNYRTIADNLRQNSGDLDRLASVTSAQTNNLRDHSPDHAMVVDNIIAKGTQHLASLLPAEPTGGPFSGPYRPSQAELSAFNRAAQIAQNPASILDHIAQGTVHPDHVAALSAIYPSIQREMSQQIIAGLANLTAKGGTIPFKTRMGLALFLGGNMDPALNPAAMQANQLAFMTAARDEQTGNVEPGSRPTLNLGVAGRMSTPMQASAARST